MVLVYWEQISITYLVATPQVGHPVAITTSADRALCCLADIKYIKTTYSNLKLRFVKDQALEKGLYSLQFLFNEIKWCYFKYNPKFIFTCLLHPQLYVWQRGKHTVHHQWTGQRPDWSDSQLHICLIMRQSVSGKQSSRSHMLTSG